MTEKMNDQVEKDRVKEKVLSDLNNINEENTKKWFYREVPKVGKSYFLDRRFKRVFDVVPKVKDESWHYEYKIPEKQKFCFDEDF